MSYLSPSTSALGSSLDQARRDGGNGTRRRRRTEDERTSSTHHRRQRPLSDRWQHDAVRQRRHPQSSPLWKLPDRRDESNVTSVDGRTASERDLSLEVDRLVGALGLADADVDFILAEVDVCATRRADLISAGGGGGGGFKGKGQRKENEP